MPDLIQSSPVSVPVSGAIGGKRYYELQASAIEQELVVQSWLNSAFLKRAFDILFGFVSLCCTAPILLVAMLLIPLETPGRPIFRQARVGKNGRIFSILKLRTMYLHSERLGFKTTRDDNRLTPLGKILRRSNIDELPQLINIILGDMSLIGPRPFSVRETEHLVESAQFARNYPGLVPTVRPGLVGLELFNEEAELPYVLRFKFNSRYEKLRTSFLDVRIFLRALFVCRYVCLAACLGAVTIIFLLTLASYL